MTMTEAGGYAPSLSSLSQAAGGAAAAPVYDASGLPSAAELTRLANELFPEYTEAASAYGIEQPEPEVCAAGIERFLTSGDTSVASYGLQKATRQAQALADQSALYQTAVPGASSLDSYAREAQRLIQELAGYGEIGTAYDSEVSGVYASAQQIVNDGIAALAGQGAADFPWLAEASQLGIAEKKSYQSVGGSFAPSVLSESQAADAVSVRAPQSGTPREIRLKASEDKVIGTKTLSQIREDFPILRETINGYPLVWLDNGATTQRPQAVIDRLSYYYTHENSNVHRGAHELAARSTDAYENARQIVADFIGAPRKEDIVFVRGTTEAINLVARAYVRPLLQPGDEIVLTYLEHHANIVPWQIIAEETGAVIKVAPVDESGQIILSEYGKLFTRRTKFASATQVSNALGTVTPVAEMIAIAHSYGVPILIDGAQSVAHMPVNVSALDADFFVFSGHKIYAPTGIGVVYGKSHLLEAARPYQGGGNMIKDVTFERTVYNPAPNKFEAGTGSIADAVGLGAALSYLTEIGMPAVAAHEHELLQYAMKEMRKIPGLHLIGTAADKASVLSFVLDGVDNEAVGQRLNELGIAVRTGHHCAQPILRRFGLEGTVRPTLALYNSYSDVDALVQGIRTLV